MIYLNRPEPPVELTVAEASKLTNEYLADNNKAVWNRDYIKQALLEMSNSKCAYCEARLDEESKYLEVDHFRPKNLYPNQVVDWPNLIPSCKHCNGSKSNHDVVAEPIVDPTAVDPKAHLSFANYRFRHRDIIGETTIEVVDLNDHDRNVRPRFDVGEAVANAVQNLRTDSVNFIANKNVRNCNKLKRGMRSLLSEALPSSQFSATASTILLRDAD